MNETRITEEEITTPTVAQVVTESGEALPPGATQVNGLPGWTSTLADREPHRRGDMRAR